MKQNKMSIVIATCFIALSAQAMTSTAIAVEQHEMKSLSKQFNKKSFLKQFEQEEQDQEHSHEALKDAPPPHQRTELPPSAAQVQFDLPLSKVDRQRLYGQSLTQNVSLNGVAPPPVLTPACQDMNTLATYSGTALADYLVNLPSYECTYGLFTLSGSQAATVFSASNVNAVLSRFTQEAGRYNATNWALLSTTEYLRAAYFLASSNTIPMPAANVVTSLRTPIYQLINGTSLYANNTEAPITANEVWKLISNTQDIAYFLPSVKNIVTRYTNTSSASGLFANASGSGGFTGVLTVLYYAHSNTAAKALLQNDLSYATALNNFVLANKASMIAGTQSFQISDTANEAFRFLQYPTLKPNVKTMVKYHLANSALSRNDGDIWIKAAAAVGYYDNASCAEYGTCNYKDQIANFVFKTNYTCSSTLKIRAQDMTTAQLQDSCRILAAEETYFHNTLATNRAPVANDNNTVLELVIFDDYTNYNKYSGAIYGNATNNGGMYLEGNPAVVGNQARFIAHEASWLRPAFSVWNLEHEYVHYLDGRFNMSGDFNVSTAKPTVWWGEGLADYMALKNDNAAAITAAKLGTYRLSTIFGNTYSMGDYVNRAYRWGYMATRFMFEKHRSDVNAILAKFRSGDYVGYQTYMTNTIGTRYDNEFAAWVQSLSSGSTTPTPTPTPVTLAPCPTTTKLDKNCYISNLSSSTTLYNAIILPAGAKNLKIFTSDGTGDVELYVRRGSYPTATSFDLSSRQVGNNESVTLAAPVANSWYYVSLIAKTPFAGVKLSATYD